MRGATVCDLRNVSTPNLTINGVVIANTWRMEPLLLPFSNPSLLTHYPICYMKIGRHQGKTSPDTF